MIFKYDTQLLIDGENLNKEEIVEYFENDLDGNSLIVAGDENLIKIHFHTDELWDVLKYCSTLGEIYDIIVEDMDRQTRVLKG